MKGKSQRDKEIEFCLMAGYEAGTLTLTSSTVAKGDVLDSTIAPLLAGHESVMQTWVSSPQENLTRTMSRAMLIGPSSMLYALDL